MAVRRDTSVIMSKPITRRAAVSGAVAALFPFAGATSRRNNFLPISPIELDHGLEIRDYRLFPTKDVMRFIVELHNTSEEIIDTPSVGLILQDAETERGFAWANPVSTVLYPGTSDLLIGVAPEALQSDDDWMRTEWMLCAQPTKRHVDGLLEWEFLVQQGLDQQAADSGRMYVTLYNLTEQNIGPFVLKSTVRDPTGRLCGSLIPIPVVRAKPSEPTYTSTEVSPDLDYIASPFTFIQTVERMEVLFSIQPDVTQFPRSCMRVLPWNRS